MLMNSYVLFWECRWWFKQKCSNPRKMSKGNYWISTINQPYFWSLFLNIVPPGEHYSSLLPNDGYVRRRNWRFLKQPTSGLRCNQNGWNLVQGGGDDFYAKIDDRWKKEISKLTEMIEEMMVYRNSVPKQLMIANAFVKHHIHDVCCIRGNH